MILSRVNLLYRWDGWARWLHWIRYWCDESCFQPIYLRDETCEHL